MPEEKARCSPALGARDVEPAGLVEHLGVPVGPAEERHHRLPDGHPHARQHPVSRCGDAAGALHGGVEPQHLVDGVGPERGLGAQPVELLRVRDEQAPCRCR